MLLNETIFKLVLYKSSQAHMTILICLHVCCLFLLRYESLTSIHLIFFFILSKLITWTLPPRMYGKIGAGDGWYIISALNLCTMKYNYFLYQIFFFNLQRLIFFMVEFHSILFEVILFQIGGLNVDYLLAALTFFHKHLNVYILSMCNNFELLLPLTNTFKFLCSKLMEFYSHYRV